MQINTTSPRGWWEGGVEKGKEKEKEGEEDKEEEEEEEEKDEEEGEEKVQGTRRKLLSMALILPGYNEVWTKINNTIGLSMHRGTHWCFDVHNKYFLHYWNTLSNAN